MEVYLLLHRGNIDRHQWMAQFSRLGFGLLRGARRTSSGVPMCVIWQKILWWEGEAELSRSFSDDAQLTSLL